MDTRLPAKMTPKRDDKGHRRDVGFFDIENAKAHTQKVRAEKKLRNRIGFSLIKLLTTLKPTGSWVARRISEPSKTELHNSQEHSASVRVDLARLNTNELVRQPRLGPLQHYLIHRKGGSPEQPAFRVAWLKAGQPNRYRFRPEKREGDLS